MIILWEKRIIHLHYGMGIYSDREVCVAQGTNLGWYLSSGSMKDPRDHYCPLHIPGSRESGPHFFSQQHAEHYIETILPITNWDEEDPDLIDIDQKRLESIADSLGYEWTWN